MCEREQAQESSIRVSDHHSGGLLPPMGVPLTQPSWLPFLFRPRIPFRSFPALSSQLPVTLIRKCPQLLQSDFTREDQGWTHLSLWSICSVPFLGPLPSSSLGQALYSTPGSWRPSGTQPRVLSTPRPPGLAHGQGRVSTG